jgi:hypothetical protein
LLIARRQGTFSVYRLSYFVLENHFTLYSTLTIKGYYLSIFLVEGVDNIPDYDRLAVL